MYHLPQPFKKPRLSIEAVANSHAWTNYLVDRVTLLNAYTRDGHTEPIELEAPASVRIEDLDAFWQLVEAELDGTGYGLKPGGYRDGGRIKVLVIA